MGSLDSNLDILSLKEKRNSLWIFILKTVSGRADVIVDSSGVEKAGHLAS